MLQVHMDWTMRLAAVALSLGVMLFVSTVKSQDDVCVYKPLPEDDAVLCK